MTDRSDSRTPLLEHSFARAFVADKDAPLAPAYTDAKPMGLEQAQLIYINRELMSDWKGDWPHLAQQSQAELAGYFAGNQALPDSQPLAQGYAGHQFGHFVPRLGDGRAILLGEIIDRQGQRFDLALKGAGRTAFSRGGDGRAALGPMLREVLIGEALHGLKIATSRAVALVRGSTPIWRDKMLPEAVLTRLARSHLRIGTVEYFAAQQALAPLRRLVDYSLQRHYPSRMDCAASERPRQLLQAVVAAQAQLIAHWMSVGFIHGVMNTDNMMLDGSSLDFGPCAFIDHYHPDRVFSSIDQHGRYAYQQQPRIAQWNLSRLASALLVLLPEASKADYEVWSADIAEFEPLYQQHYLALMRSKLGWPEARDSQAASSVNLSTLINQWLALLTRFECDYTLAWYALGEYLSGFLNGDLSEKLSPPLSESFSVPRSQPTAPSSSRGLLQQFASANVCAAAHDANHHTALLAAMDECLPIWCVAFDWQASDGPRSVHAALARMRAANPIVIARNHQVEAAIHALQTHADSRLFERLIKVLRDPFSLPPEADRDLMAPPSAAFSAQYRTFCGT